MPTAVQDLPSRPSLEQYRKQAKDLVKACKSGDRDAIQRIDTFPRPRRRTGFALADAQFVIAREHGFVSWPQFAAHVEALSRGNSPAARFEAAVDAVITGDEAQLQRLLREDPELIQARSARRHHAALLHYVGANGVEDFRQKTPKNAVRIAEILLDAGAEIDAVADLYGGATTLELAATSVHPVRAGVQIALLETLLRRGATVERVPGATVNSCLANGRKEAAEFLAEHGGALDLEGAAGVGRLDRVKSFFNDDGTLKENATKAQMRSGFNWACEYGRTDVVDFLLQKGIEVGVIHRGETGLHWAAYGGHAEIVRLLLEHKAPVDLKDESFGQTPLGWALYGWGEPPAEAVRNHYEVVALLVAAGAPMKPEWLADVNLQADPRMRAALRSSR